MPRTFRHYQYKDAAFNIACAQFEAVTAEIVRQRELLEGYIARDPRFLAALAPIDVPPDAPEVARRMAAAGWAAGVGPMAAVAGAMAQAAARAGLEAGAAEAIVENGGDVFLAIREPVQVALHTGATPLAGRLAFLVQPGDTPLAICSSSGQMGRSFSFGRCDLATVVAADAALADAAVTHAANLVASRADVDAALRSAMTIPGVMGVLLVKDERIGLMGRLPELVRNRGVSDRHAWPLPKGLGRGEDCPSARPWPEAGRKT